jgi:hypothetical protein
VLRRSSCGSKSELVKPNLDHSHATRKTIFPLYAFGGKLRTNYVLIDYENVQPEALSALDAEHFKVIVFVGANQAKLTFETAAALQRMGSKAEYVKISGNGSNALDFHIAFYIGQLAGHDSTAYFHIVSRDTGFDPLIQHLKTKKIFAARSRDVHEIPLVKASNSKSPPEKIAVVVTNLQQRGASKPRTVKTLLSTISAVFQKQLTEPEVDALLTELQHKGYITINETKVSYTLPAPEV